MELGNILFGNSRGKFPINRDWISHFKKLLNAFHIDSYGYFNTTYFKYDDGIGVLPSFNEKYDSKYQTFRGGFENEVFKIEPYYWGDEDEEKEKPNFLYKPTGYCINWYKYPFRDSYANQDISEEEFAGIIDKCINLSKENYEK